MVGKTWTGHLGSSHTAYSRQGLILIWLLDKAGLSVKRVMWLRVRTSSGLMWKRKWIFGVHKGSDQLVNYNIHRHLRKYVEIKCQLDTTDDIYCRFYCLLNMFRAPLCPSSGARKYYTDGRCLWYLVLWFSSCRYVVELRVMCPVCRLQPDDGHNGARNMLSKQ